jgi:hypothetical protein
VLVLGASGGVGQASVQLAMKWVRGYLPGFYGWNERHRCGQPARTRAAGADAVTGLKGVPMPCSAASGHGLRDRPECLARAPAHCWTVSVPSNRLLGSPDRSTGVPRARVRARAPLRRSGLRSVRRPRRKRDHV